MTSMDELRSFEHYFLHWLGDLEVTPDMASDIESEIPFSRPDTFEEDKDSFGDIMRMMTLQDAVGPFVTCFLELYSSDFDEADITMRYIDDMISHIDTLPFMSEYMGGIHYLFRVITLHRDLVHPRLGTPLDQEPSIQELTQDFNTLKPKEKSIISTAHWIMNEAIRSRKEVAVDNLKEMLQLDPTNWVWNYLMCSRTRFLRRTHGYGGNRFNPSGLPSQVEIDSATSAVEHCTDLHYRLICTAAVSQVMAEIVRAKVNTGDYSQVTVGKKEYANLQLMVDDIIESACEALMELSCGFAEYIRYGEILGLILPVQYRNYMVAAACMKTAWAIVPDNSKVNHKMGSIILNWRKDTKRAVKFFRNAVLNEPHNFPAWMDLLPSLISDFDENRTKFDALFEIAKKCDSDWKESQRGPFAFFQGCIALLNGDKNQAIKFWLQSIGTDYNGFKELSKMRNRYAWPKDHALTLDLALEAISSAQESGDFTSDTVSLSNLKTLASSAKHEQDLFHQRQQQRQLERTGSNDGHAHGNGDAGMHQRPLPGQQRQRSRNSNSWSEADNDNMWRRSSGGPVGGGPRPLLETVPDERQFGAGGNGTGSSGNSNWNRGGGGGGGRRGSEDKYKPKHSTNRNNSAPSSWR